MDIQTLHRVVEFLNTHSTLESINAVIQPAEREAQKRIEHVELVAKEAGVNIQVHEDSTVASFVAEATGIYHHPCYEEYFKAHTARFHKWHMLFYSVRDGIGQNLYYNVINADVNREKGFVKMSALDTYMMRELNVEVKREYKNGNVEYYLNESLDELLNLVLAVREYFAERGC